MPNKTIYLVVDVDDNTIKGAFFDFDNAMKRQAILGKYYAIDDHEIEDAE